MSVSLIPDDPLTRKLLAKVLAAMIHEDFEKARAGGAGCQPNTPSTAVDADHTDWRQGHCTARPAKGQGASDE